MKFPSNCLRETVFVGNSVNMEYDLFISHFNVCVSVLEPKWQALLLYFTHQELSVCVWFTRLIQTLMENDTDCFTHTRSYELCALSYLGQFRRCKALCGILGKNVFHASRSEAEILWVQESPFGSHFTVVTIWVHLKLLQNDC